MRYQVPQFVDIEDKIIGPFTLKQFLLYLSAALLLIPVYIFSDLALFITVAVPVGGIAAMFAHLKIHGKSLFSVIINALTYFTKGQLSLWRRVPGMKPLKVAGEEYNGFADAEVAEILSLRERARVLETAGRVVTEDAEDPLDPEATPAASRAV